MNRRGFLSIAAKTPLIVGPSLVLAPALVSASAMPSRFDVRRYYSFLWGEFAALEADAGFERFDSMAVWWPDEKTGLRPGDFSTPPASERPSARALRVLTAAGL